MFWYIVSAKSTNLPGAAIELPEDAVLADRVEQLLAVEVDEHALEAVLHVERFAGNVLVVPADLAGVRIERERRYV